jgi:predicted ATPase
MLLYRGDFLEGDYDNWVVAERERLATLYETVLSHVMRTSKDAEAARRFVARNPYDEGAYATLIEADLAAGRRSSASRWVERCRKALAEVEERPSASFESRFGNIARIDPLVDMRTNNLPRQRTSFVGRDEELSEIRTLLTRSQVVTIVGPAGVGKTRIALQLGGDLLEGSGDGVWFVDLAQVIGEAYVIPEVASVFGMHSQGDRSLLDQVLADLKNKRLLLLLDNCEHVVAEASSIVTAICKTCDGVTILATSRERLNIQGEQVYRLPSLAVPPSDVHLNAKSALGFAAVALFAARAAAVDAQFTLSDDKCPAVVDICRRLDGVALAIELAAARVTMLNVRDLARRLDERLSLLTGGDRTADARQRTLRAAIDWSYDLLSRDECAVFRRSSIFQGGWTLEAASAVCLGTSLDQIAIFETLSSLVDKSLVTVDIHEASQRYRLLESVRQYGIERLKQEEEFDAARRRHAAHFGEFGRQAAANWRSTTETAWLGMIEEEVDNIRAALEWSLVQGNDPVRGAELVERLWAFWWGRHYAEGRHWIQIAQSAVTAESHPSLSAALALAAFRLVSATGSRAEALEAGARSLREARALGDEHLISRALFYYGEGLVIANRLDDAELLLRESLELAQCLGHGDRVAPRLQALGRLYRKRGDLTLARDYLSKAMQSYESAPHERNKALALIDEASLEHREGNLARAIEFVTEARRMAQSLRDRRLEVIADYSKAYYHILSGELDDARAHARSALQMSREERFIFGIPCAVQVIVGAAIQKGELSSAARLLGYAKANFPELMLSQDAFVDIDGEWLVQPLREHFGEIALATLMGEGARWAEDQAVDEALKV